MKFYFQARTKEGLIRTGTIEALNREEALKTLQNYNLIVTKLKPHKRERLKIFKGKVNPKEIFFFFKQLSILIDAGVSLVRALDTYAKQTRNILFRKQILEMVSDIEGGVSFSQVLARFPALFSPFVIGMIKIAETTGGLAKILRYIANYLEKEIILKSKIKGAMYYPAFVLVASAILSLIILFFVAPKITSVFKEMDVELPIITRVFLFVVDFLVSIKGLIFFLILIFLIIILWKYLKTPSGKRKKDWVEIKFPILGSVFRNIYLAKISGDLSSLIKGGIPVTQALVTIGAIIGNTFYKEVIEKTLENVRKGELISKGFFESDIISPSFAQIVAAGEEGGKLEKVLDSLNKFYTTEIEISVNALVELLQPILIIILALGVGFIAASVILPIYNIVGVIQ